jgi:hypothetical protein
MWCKSSRKPFPAVVVSIDGRLAENRYALRRSKAASVSDFQMREIADRAPSVARQNGTIWSRCNRSRTSCCHNKTEWCIKQREISGYVGKAASGESGGRFPGTTTGRCGSS